MSDTENENIITNTQNISEAAGNKVANVSQNKKELTVDEKLKIIKARQSIASRKYHEKKKKEQEEKLRNPTFNTGCLGES
jgi:hypothetical protein